MVACAVSINFCASPINPDGHRRKLPDLSRFVQRVLSPCNAGKISAVHDVQIAVRRIVVADRRAGRGEGKR